MNAMNPGPSNHSIPTPIRDAAARWVVQRDRGFSTEEAAAFERWLQEDPRHAAAMSRSTQVWTMLERATKPADVPAPGKIIRVARWRWIGAGTLAAAAAVAVLFWRSAP